MIDQLSSTTLSVWIIPFIGTGTGYRTCLCECLKFILRYINSTFASQVAMVLTSSYSINIVIPWREDAYILERPSWPGHSPFIQQSLDWLVAIL